MAIAQMNWGRFKYPLEDKRMIEFDQSLNEVYSLVENHPGFIWCIPDNQVELQLTNLGFDKFISSTVSIWNSVDSLKNYIYNSLYGIYLKRSSEWFKEAEEPQLVIWNVKNDDRPTFKESFERLAHLKINGPTDFAYGWEK